MNKTTALITGIILSASSILALGQETIPDVFADPAIDLNIPEQRAEAVKRIHAIEIASLKRARAKANAMGIPLRREFPGGRVTEIVGLDENGDFLIYSTDNTNAAISTAANLVNAAPYNLAGSGITVGVWDGGAVRNTHQEFATGSRVTIMDGASFNDHATHVAGTIAAAGVSASAKGMAFQALVHSYDWNSDTSEMTNRAATAPGQVDKIYISNHSYGFVEGWNGSNWTGVGTDQNAYDPQFGQYSSAARNWDVVAFNAPYYLPFKSAGNDNSNNPATGSTVTIGGNTVAYDPAIHPKGDGLYRNTTTNSANGYENIGTNGTAKNIMTVGAANDAVTSGQRDPAKSTLTAFSSRGPTDDGRIKPDIVANGAGLYSPVSGSNNTSYSTYSGTSMSSPNAAGSAALLVQHYANLFSGGAMRASTLKGLIIHTATDIGNPGPDYHYGWGLMNTKEAADLITDHQANPSKHRMTEDHVTTSQQTQSYTFNWDGVSPLRATLCWTDPAGASTTSHDLRSSRLVNNLDLKLIAPNGTQYYPYTMPFVGTWTVASMSQHATTGINNTDNVEQVYLQNPGQTGAWQVVVTYQGTLTNNQQHFSLLLSGAQDVNITLENLNHTYDGTPKSASVTTSPAGLAHTVTYDGSSTAPVNAGAYAVVATITDPNYTGSASGSLVINKASQTINFGALASVPADSTPFALTATASSGLDVSYTSSDPAVATVSGNIVTVISSGSTTITASQTGNTNYNAATPVQQSLTVTPVDGAPVSALAEGETTNLGTVTTGSFSNTWASDNSYQVLTESLSGGSPKNRMSQLEHVWTFNVAAGELVTFYVEAYHTANTEGDNFRFAYSTDGTNYTDMVTVTKTNDDNVPLWHALPGDLRGVVYVRVVDTNRTAGRTSLESLYVDHLTIVSESASSPPGLATNPSPADGATGISVNRTLKWEPAEWASSHDVYFGTTPVFQGNQTATTFNPGTLAPLTTYYWRVDEVNNIGTTAGSVWSFTTAEATPEMYVSAITLGVAKSGKNYQGAATVKIVNASTGQPVVGATVTGNFTGSFAETASAVTDSAGNARVLTSAKKALPLSFTFTVTNVTDSVHTYRPTLNIVTSASGSF